MTLTLTLPDGKALDLPDGSTGLDAARAIGKRLAEAAVAVRLDGVELDLSRPLTHSGALQVITGDSEDGRHVLRHSAAHILAQAVLGLFEGATFAIGPPIEDGFYYDFDIGRAFTPEDLANIEARMAEIVAADQPFERLEMSKAEALKMFAKHPFKTEIIQNVDEGEVAAGDSVSAYRNSEFIDLCRGPHLPSTGRLAAFSLLRTAGAYWRGDEKRPQLQRIYGTAWENRKALDAYVHRLEEARKRDHRKLGTELEIFHLDVTAPGMPYWLPNGMRILNTLLAFWREEHDNRDYQEISSPLINDKSLWEVSGHWEHYRDSMFLIELDENRTYGVKPMNCPNAMLVYNLKTRSYRDLPLRFSDCDVLHRNERSGTLHGLLRVQHIQQDDAHIFLAPHQVKDEYRRILEIAEVFYSVFGLKYKLRLGTRPEAFIGEIETWDEAERVLREILDDHAGPGGYAVANGDGAFYGPKIDILMEDAIGREWQMGTIQLDFQLPQRFRCQYTTAEGERKTPVVVHRVIYGSFERFIGILIEHFAGRFPAWLSPTQVEVVPVTGEESDAARALTVTLRAAGLRAKTEESSESLSAKIRSAQLAQIPYMAVLGKKEVANGSVAVRFRDGKQVSMSVADFIGAAKGNISTKALVESEGFPFG